ncbi:MAG: ABC transporter substrate-binding protein, partial [Gammaproteobacteria bacterium]|nr:ABC transporter substrate-binding protein [Gammaproteobacteria bacterium]
TFPIPINYRLHKKGDKWLVYDVTIDEISLIANYRTSFANEIRKTNIDKLISQLEKKNLEAKGG